MKLAATLLFFSYQLLISAQSDTLLKVKISKVRTDQLYTYYTFDSIADRHQKLIIIKELWVENELKANFKKIDVGFKGKVYAYPIGPKKVIVGGDTLEMRGLPPTFIIEGVKLERGYNSIRIDRYHLKEMKR